jgi:hypothetical protein
MHTAGAQYLQDVYPKFADFVALRNFPDPGRRLGNAYLQRVLGNVQKAD